ncbi:TonB-dependent receptor [Hymenobacter sp. HMF4947]|uniref:TonB-dependent receptor n=1 Tax=Hymenobacter ginkgonis TaxID=2682976 RepID=A0A7K1TK99_9BACT|nr:carboxypeptidase regulatory-like domain-containing protein [Hymenobacter ginkgonis]MVN78837.1 TonB-dependent receptor [Hymenobacter ginkgonis]
MKQKLFTLLLLLLLTASAYAQVTTSSLTGLIKDAKGEPSIGATIRAVHTPSGTSYGVAANGEGRFTIQNMRIGGPYTVEISFVGARSETRSGITLQLGQPYVLNVTLATEGTQLQEVTVTATNPRSILNSDKTGSITVIDRNALQRLPSISRNLNDFTRLTPQASGQAIGGGSNRSNYFSVDGSDFNNNFGIGGNLPANGAPISLDAIEEISVNITPYDVRQSGFTGAAINAVTRAGTNDFSGSAYVYYRNQSYQGSRVGDQNVVLQDQRFYQYGARLGGPIIKDKLFFFANYETEENRTPGQQRTAATASAPFGSSTNVARPTAAELDSYAAFLRDKYGYDPGAYQGYSFVAPRTKILGRLDWNIAQNHHFNVRYSQVEGKSPSFPSTSRSPFGGYRYPNPNGSGTFLDGSGNRQNNTALFYENANYFQESNFYSLAAELNSTFGSQGSTTNTLRGTFTRQNDPRSSPSSTLFPFVDILKDGTPFTSFGTEPFTYGNLRDVKIYSVKDDFTWVLGRNNFTAGYQGDFSETKNGFQRFGTGYYTFASWDDFANNKLPIDFGITYSLTPGYEQAFPSFKYQQHSLYLQDEMAVSDRLRVTGGLRVDLTHYANTLRSFQQVANLTFAGGEKVDVAALPGNQVLYSPRLGFNLDVLGDRSLQLRGGSGIFTGRVPYVWIVSQAGDAGTLQVTQTYGASQGSSNPTVPGPFNPDPTAYRPTVAPQPGSVIPSTTSSLAQNFRFPQTWKSSLAVDAKLPFGVVGTVEAIVNRDINAAVYKNANLVDPQALGVSGYPDTRLIYPNANSNKFINPLTTAGQPVANGAATGTGAYNTIVLDNASRGYYFSLTGKLDKQFSSNLFGSLAYTYTNSKNLFDGGGDQPLSAWQGTATVNGSNNLALGYNGNTLPHRVIASLSYRQEYLGHLGTTISLYYEGATQGRYSYVYSADFNRDGANADLIYIPKDASEITFVPVTVGTGTAAVTYSAQQQSDAFFAFVDQDKYLSKHKGEYAERNGAQYPWRNEVDVKILQDIFANVGGKRNSLQVSLDIFNFGNLLNNNWGRVQQTTFNNFLEPQNVANLTTAASGPKPTFRLGRDNVTSQLLSTTFRNAVSLSSTYYMQLGLRYTFN